MRFGGQGEGWLPGKALEQSSVLVLSSDCLAPAVVSPGAPPPYKVQPLQARGGKCRPSWPPGAPLCALKSVGIILKLLAQEVAARGRRVGSTRI